MTNGIVYLGLANLVSMGRGANLRRPVLKRLAVQEGEGLRVCGAERSRPRALVASGAVLTSVSAPAILSSVARCATLRHPEEKGKKMYVKKTRHIKKWSEKNISILTAHHNF